MSQSHLTKTTFASLQLPEILRQGIEKAGFSHCTPIQAEALPIALSGHDVLGQAQTGTGKTAAFLISAINRLLATPRADQPRCLILAPTRELAVQIHNDALPLCEFTDLKVGVVFGGTGYDTQKNMLEAGVDLLVATPGRVIDFYKQRLFNLKHIEVMVLDEADRMFDLGFIKDIRFLLRNMPPPQKRLNMLFSATMPYRVTELAYEHMNNPKMVKIAAELMTADKVEQYVYYTSNEEKIPLLLGILKSGDMTRTLVFANTRHATNRIAEYLLGNGFETAILSGEVPQKTRMSLLKRFQAGELPILVATDVAARGLHIEGISHVVNFDLPQDAEDYVHRIGRTARAGATGEAYSFACEQYAFSLPEIEAYVGNKITVRQVDPELLVTPKPRKHIKRETVAKRGKRSEGDQSGQRRHKSTRQRSGGRRPNKTTGNAPSH